MNFEVLKNVDEEILDVISNELGRQRTKIELIASENFVSQAVMQTMGSPLTNKYAEGYPAKRYYGGCEHVDVAENLAIERAKALFGAEHVNVQPHSGAQANMAVFFAMLTPGDTILGMNLAHGGHLTHGSPVNISGKHYSVVPYGVQPDTFLLDYDEIRKLARQHQPKLIIAGASAYPREIDFKAFREIADEVGAFVLADVAHIAGLIAAGIHNSPIPHCHFVTTTTHKTLRGPRGGLIMCHSQFAKEIDKAVFPGIQGGPLMHVIAAKAVSFKEALAPEFKTYQKQVVANAKAMANAFLEREINIVSGGTDNHLMLLDLRNLGITGKEAQHRLDEVNITTNKNGIPFDTQSPFITSGIRIGTPAVTTRGMKEADMIEIADLISLTVKDFEGNKEQVLKRVDQLCQRYPLYQ